MKNQEQVFPTRSHTSQSYHRKNKIKESPTFSKTAPVSRAQTPIKRLRYIAHDYDRFGADSPSWTIPSSRHSRNIIVDCPPPGYYDIPDNLSNTKYSHSIQERVFQSYRTITSDVDITPSRIFPEIRPATIGQRPQYSRETGGDTPAPNYCPPGIETGKGVHISSRYPEPKPDKTPSVGQYSPKDYSRPTSKLGTFPHKGMYNFPRGHNIPNSNPVTPGPGEYNVNKPIPPAHRWTDRLRSHRKHYKPKQVTVFTTFENTQNY